MNMSVGMETKWAGCTLTRALVNLRMRINMTMKRQKLSKTIKNQKKNL